MRKEAAVSDNFTVETKFNDKDISAEQLDALAAVFYKEIVDYYNQLEIKNNGNNDSEHNAA